MVTFDWRRCPYPNQAPDGPVSYGPLATDVGSRATDMPPWGVIAPGQSIVGSTAHGCPPDYFAWAAAGVLGYIAAAAGAFGSSLKKVVT